MARTGHKWNNEQRAKARIQRDMLSRFGASFYDASKAVENDGRKQFLIATPTAIVNEYRNGAAALIRLRELGKGHILFDRVSRKIIAHI